MLPILLGLLIIPLSTFWAATQKINRDLIGYIRSLYDFSEQNEKNSQELRTSSELMSSASSQQSAAIQQSVASIAQIRIMLAETEAHVREVQTLATQMSDETLKGSEIMERMQKSMIAIEETNSQIASFEEILSSIRGKTQVINDIVFKTQLLSFNASIEAARAGHYGRGFSVVAEEVGKLAMMSGDAAREIDLLLAQSGDRVSNILQSVQDRVVDGRKVSQEAANKFGHLTEKLSAISEKIAQVANATVEQGGGIEQTAKAMDQVSQGAAENKKGAEEVHRVADLVFEMSAKIRAVKTCSFGSRTHA
jgi:methyl-accepting chemotaxis protein